MDKIVKHIKGEPIASFFSTKETPLWALLRYSLGMTLWFGLMIYSYLKGSNLDLLILLGAIGLIFVYAAWRLATRHKRARVKIYPEGLWVNSLFGVGAKGFYSWDNIIKVEQCRHDGNVSPTYLFLPGYYIRFKDGKHCFVTQTLDNYTGLYKMLFLNKVRNSDKKLYLYETDNEGFQLKNEFTYDAIYLPDKDKLTKERGQPIVY